MKYDGILMRMRGREIVIALLACSLCVSCGDSKGNPFGSAGAGGFSVAGAGGAAGVGCLGSTFCDGTQPVCCYGGGKTACMSDCGGAPQVCDHDSQCTAPNHCCSRPGVPYKVCTPSAAPCYEQTTCGANAATCSTEDEGPACCVDGTGNGRCAPSWPACGDTDQLMFCDGPETCPNGEACCYSVFGARGTAGCQVQLSSCVAEGWDVLCHHDADCMGTPKKHCCPFHNWGVKACSDSPC
jgi:hypothetical protein